MGLLGVVDPDAGITASITLSCRRSLMSTDTASYTTNSSVMAFSKTWRSDEVPDGLVVQHGQQHPDMGGKPFRTPFGGDDLRAD